MTREDRARQALIDSSDHDVLITLVGTVASNHATILDKMSDLQKDVSEIKTDSNYNLLEHEKRIRSLEKTRDEFNPAEVAKIAREANDFAKFTRQEEKQARNRQTFIMSVIVVIIQLAIALLNGIWGFLPIHR